MSKRLSERNFKDADLMQIMRDKITLDRVKELLAANFQPPVTEVEDIYAQGNEEITAYALKRSLEDFRKEITVTDEEIAARYEEDKETLMSEEKRKIEYVYFQAPIFPKPTPPAPTPPIPGASLQMPEADTEKDPTSLLQPSNRPVMPFVLAEEPAPAPATGEAAADEATGEVGSAAEATEPATDESADEATEGDPCGSPQDEPAEEAPVDALIEDLEQGAADATGAVDAAADAVDAAAEAAADATDGAASLAEEIVDSLKEELSAPEPAAPTPGAPNTTPAPAAPAEPVMSPEEKKEAKREFVSTVNTEYNAARSSDGSVDLDKLGKSYLAAAAGKKFSGSHTTTELFTREDPPEFLKDVRPSRSNRNPVDVIFGLKEGEVSAPERLSIDDREDWFICRVLEIVEPRQLSLDEAKEKLTETAEGGEGARRRRDRTQGGRGKNQSRDGG